MKKILILLITAIILTTNISALSGTVATQSTSLNVRSLPSTSSQVVGSLAKGSTVNLNSQVSDGWWSVTYNGATAYVSSMYIKVNNSSLSAVSLDLPKYRQYDSRWSSIRLGGTYGGTIASIGCTVTSLAMAETYRLGYTVTPADIAYNYSFTAGGAIYWDNGYNSFYPDNVTGFIYNKLKSGIPVLVHAKKYNGSTHWVVVDGFTGGALEAQNFTINDPASDYRTTLADYFTVYPVFVKCVSQ